MMDSSGNNKEKLTSFGSIGTHPFNPWSPDGSKLLYMSTSSGSYELWTMDTDGSNKKQLTEGAYIENYLGQRGWDASWSPNGKQVVYVSASSENTKDSDIWIIDSNGSNGTKLTDNGKQN
jgi:TolB protein